MRYEGNASKEPDTTLTADSWLSSSSASLSRSIRTGLLTLTPCQCLARLSGLQCLAGIHVRERRVCEAIEMFAKGVYHVISLEDEASRIAPARLSSASSACAREMSVS